MFNKLTNKEIRNMLFEPESHGLNCIDVENLQTELFERTGEEI